MTRRRLLGLYFLTFPSSFLAFLRNRANKTRLLQTGQSLHIQAARLSAAHVWLQRRVLATALTTPQVPPPPSSDLGRSRTGNFFEARLGGAETRHVCNGLQDSMLSKVLCAKHECQ